MGGRKQVCPWEVMHVWESGYAVLLWHSIREVWNERPYIGKKIATRSWVLNKGKVYWMEYSLKRKGNIHLIFLPSFFWQGSLWILVQPYRDTNEKWSFSFCNLIHQKIGDWIYSRYNVHMSMSISMSFYLYLYIYIYLYLCLPICIHQWEYLSYHHAIYYGRWIQLRFERCALLCVGDGRKAPELLMIAWWECRTLQALWEILGSCKHLFRRD